jgi:hypothetical protein
LLVGLLLLLILSLLLEELLPGLELLFFVVAGDAVGAALAAAEVASATCLAVAGGVAFASLPAGKAAVAAGGITIAAC